MVDNSPIFNTRMWQLLMLVLILGFVWRGFFIYRDVEWLTNYWLFEDFGYSLKIAKNIAFGFGETFDGVIPTNGYQPLYVWLMVPVFLFFKTNLVTPIHIALTFLAIANVATGIFIYFILKQLTQKDAWGLLGIFIWMFNLAIAKDGTNGLETGFSTFMIAATSSFYLSLNLSKTRFVHALILGVLLGLSFLARVDAVFLFAAVFITILWSREVLLRDRFRIGGITAFYFMLIIMPYIVWNMIHYGYPLPTSGLVTTGKSDLFAFSKINFTLLLNNLNYGLYIIGRMLIGLPSVNGWVSPPSIFPKYISMITLALIFIGFIISAWKRNIPICFLMLLGLFYMYGYIIYSFVAFERYFLPVVFVFVILCIFLIHHIFSYISEKFILMIGIMLSIFFIGFSKSFIFSEFPQPLGWYKGIMELNKIVAPHSVVAASQAGNLGYFYTKGRAINLDGVVNLAAYYAREKGVLWEYIQQQKINYLADEGDWVFRIANDIKNDQMRARFLSSLKLVFKTNAYRFNIYKIEHPDYILIRKLKNTKDWQWRENNQMTFGYASFASYPGAKLEFSSSRCFDMKFLKHNFSGKVKIFKDGVLIRNIDLYSAVADPTYKEFFNQDSQYHLYRLEVSDQKNPASLGTEVWMDAVLERKTC